MLSKRWAGDHILFLGDERSVQQDTENQVLYTLYKQSVEVNLPGDAFDTVIETYRNLSGLFKATENVVRQEITYYLDYAKCSIPRINEYGIDIERPFYGLFELEECDFKYTVNHSKKIAYSFEKTKILNLDDIEYENVDPLPILMAYGRSGENGAWLGDIIGVTDELPEGYTLLDCIRFK